MKFATIDIMGVATAGILLAAQPLAGQAFEMNFFLVVEGPTWGPTQPSVRISDSHCHDQAYAEGFGHGDRFGQFCKRTPGGIARRQRRISNAAQKARLLDYTRG